MEMVGSIFLVGVVGLIGPIDSNLLSDGSVKVSIFYLGVGSSLPLGGRDDH